MIKLKTQKQTKKEKVRTFVSVILGSNQINLLCRATDNLAPFRYPVRVLLCRNNIKSKSALTGYLDQALKINGALNKRSDKAAKQNKETKRSIKEISSDPPCSEFYPRFKGIL